MQLTLENPKNTKSDSLPFSRNNPFQAKVLKNINLNGTGSSKETRHIELSLKGSGLTYVPGDALGIVPANDPELVAALVEEMVWDKETAVIINKQGETLPLKEALSTYFEITLLTKKILQQAAAFTENEELHKLVLVENVNQLKEYCYGRDLLDMLRDFGPWKASAQEIVSLLRKMTPRLYSIASSITANPDEVHLTIGAVRYTANERRPKWCLFCLMCRTCSRRGYASKSLCKRINISICRNPKIKILLWLVQEQALHHSVHLSRNVQ